MKKLPQCFHSENSAKTTGFITIGPVVRNHISSKKGRKIECSTANNVPFVVPGLSASTSSSSSPTSPTSSSQEAVTLTENPASMRSESVSEEVRGNSSHGLPGWLEEFKDNLVDESFPEHQYSPRSSHELPILPRAKAESGKHSIFTHFPKDRNCDICMRTKITRAILQKTQWYRRAQSGKF